MWQGEEWEWHPPLEQMDGAKKMTDTELEIHLMGIFVPSGPDEDENQTWSKVYQAWSAECDRLNFTDRARFYREKAELYRLCARIHEFDPLGR